MKWLLLLPLLLVACAPAVMSGSTLEEFPVGSQKEAALAQFTPYLRTQLEQIPIRTEVNVKAGEDRGIGSPTPSIILSTSWASYDSYTQRSILIHEYLHHAFALAGLDTASFCQTLKDYPGAFRASASVAFVQDAYASPHRCPGFAEEFAYVGEWIVMSRLSAQADGVDPHVRMFYAGVLGR